MIFLTLGCGVEMAVALQKNWYPANFGRPENSLKADLGNQLGPRANTSMMMKWHYRYYYHLALANIFRTKTKATE